MNKTEELGITSKQALIFLYEYILDKVNKTIHYQIEDYIQDNILFLYRENNYIFKNMFFNYYIKNGSEILNTDNIFKFNYFFEEFIFDNKFNKTLEDISKTLLEEFLFNKLNEQIQNKLTNIMANISEILMKYKGEIFLELNNIETAELYESMKLLSEMIYNYTILVNEQNNRFKFIVSNSPLQKFKEFSQNYLEPPLNEIKKYYDIIQNELINKIQEIVSNMRDSYADIQLYYNITEQMNEMFNILKETYDNLINYSQELTDDINDFDEILILYTHIERSSNEFRKLNDYLRGNKRNLGDTRNIFILKKNEELLNKIKRLADEKFKNKKNTSNQITELKENKRKNGFKYKYNQQNNLKSENLYKKKSNSKKNSYQSKKKRKLSTHTDQGSITKSIIRQESEKLMKTIKIFNRTNFGKDYIKITNNWYKEEINIKKYLVNAERTINLSVLKLASIITEDKIDNLKNILYFKYNQIDSYINQFLNLTTILKDNYINLIEMSSEML